MNKQGVFVVGIIAVLVAFLAVVGMLAKIFGAFDIDNNHFQACHAALGAKKLEQDVLGNALNVVDQNCLTSTFTIDAKKYNTRSKVSKYFADMLAQVWFVTHEGTIKEMWDNENMFGGSWFDNNECVVLATVAFEGKLDEEETVNTISFDNYLLDEYYLLDNAGMDWTYYQYFQDYGKITSGAKASRGLLMVVSPDFEITSGKTYSIAVASMEDGSAWGPTLSGVAVGVAVGVSLIFAIPSGGASLLVLGSVAAVSATAGTVTAVGADWLSDFSEEDPRPTALILGYYEDVRQTGCTEQTARDTTR